ncbi:unnamed protein product [Onchocerca ochengi]|uniref:Uncharacterized protein n=1 Tax=Onchocerca ochengi TaxID=42157 RepID=A0A182DZW0_ONCOC|nr:unnamed protein product [Onchocerca ochengi]VDK66180.1 unnamed protein product [Onchocerca ochengi]VDK66595.1 unnamed protein product [Onchocerca ochengi]
MSDLLSDNDKKLIDKGMINFTKLKSLNESCITDSASLYTMQSYHDNSSSVNSCYDQTTTTESNDPFSSSSISSLTSNKLKSSPQNQTNGICSKKETNSAKSIFESISTQQSSQTSSDDLKNHTFADEMSQISYPCSTARIIVPEEITDLGFNIYQISDHQRISEQSDKTNLIKSVNILSESNT